MGRVFYYPQDDINTDMMFPGKYTYGSSDPEFIKEHLFEDLDPEFHKLCLLYTSPSPRD